MSYSNIITILSFVRTSNGPKLYRNRKPYCGYVCAFDMQYTCNMQSISKSKCCRKFDFKECSIVYIYTNNYVSIHPNVERSLVPLRERDREIAVARLHFISARLTHLFPLHLNAFRAVLQYIRTDECFSEFLIL